MSSSKELKKLVGQLFIVGFDGFSVPADIKKIIQEFCLSGVIYYKRNVQSPAQLAELSNELQFSCRPEGSAGMLISIDHEGGKINRLVKPFTKFPGNDYLGDLNSPKIGFEFGYILGQEIKAVGINTNYAPVIDVLTNPKNVSLKGRSFSHDPEICAKLASAVCRGVQKAGVMAVAKHFLGYGAAEEDPHLSLPKINRSIADLEKTDLVPFRRVVRSRVEGIMTGHLLNTALDPKLPATLSAAVVDEILRKQLRYSKLIFTDDMEMKAITDGFSAEEAAVLAITAGCDCLVYKSGPPLAVIEAVIRSVEQKKITLERIEQSVARIDGAKRIFADTKNPIDVTEVGKHIGLPEHFKLADAILNKEKPAGEEEAG